MSKNQNLIIDTKYKELQKILPLISTSKESAAKAALSTTLEGVDRSTVKKIFKKVRLESNTAQTKAEKNLLKQLHAHIQSYLTDSGTGKEEEVKSIILGTGPKDEINVEPIVIPGPIVHEAEEKSEQSETKEDAIEDVENVEAKKADIEEDLRKAEQKKAKLDKIVNGSGGDSDDRTEEQRSLDRIR